jgi:hypothetical protein
MTDPLTITVTDPELLAELARYGDEPEQQHIAEAALSIGIQALRHARGEVDAQSLQQTAERILAQLDQRVEQHLSAHSQRLLQQFSLDHPDSVLSRIVTQQDGHHRRLVEHTNTHYTEIRTSLQEMSTRKQMLRQTSQGGNTFEQAVGLLVSEIASGAGDHCEATGDVEGTISKSKVGDFLITLGSDCAAAGERLVIEAKRDKSYNRDHVLAECKTARENRDAQVALFVWDMEYGKARHHPPLVRYGNDVVALWNEHDPTTYIYVEAAYWLARSIVAPPSGNERVARVQERLITGAFEQIMGLSTTLEQIKKAGEQTVKHGQTVVAQSLSVQSQLAAQVDTLRDLVIAHTATQSDEASGSSTNTESVRVSDDGES